MSRPYYVNHRCYVKAKKLQKSDKLSCCINFLFWKRRILSLLSFFQFCQLWKPFCNYFRPQETRFITWNKLLRPTAGYFPAAIDNRRKLCYILNVKSYDERHAFPVRISERSPFGARVPVPCQEWYHFPSCASGNAAPVTPVTASMSDGYAVTRVEPWNTIFVSHPWFRSGDGNFLYPIPLNASQWKKNKIPA